MDPVTFQAVPSAVTNVVVPKIGTLIPNRIFVGGITSTTTEEDLRLFFARFGQVKDVKIINDRSGLSKGNYGFVTFEHQDTAERIIKNESDSLMFNDRKLNIGHAVRKQNVLPRQYENGSLGFPPPTISSGLNNGVSYIPVANQGAQIPTNNLYTPTLLIPQQPTSSVDCGHHVAQPSSHPDASMLQVSMNSSALRRDQCHSYVPSANFIPAGSVLFTHTPVIVPNTGLASSNAIEVLYAPQTQSLQMPQAQTVSHFHAPGPLPHTSPCFHEAKSQEYAAWMKSALQQRVQNFKQQQQQQQQEIRRNGAYSALFQQDQSLSPRPTNAQATLLQKLLAVNGGFGENPTEFHSPPQYPRNLDVSADPRMSYLDEGKSTTPKSMPPCSALGPAGQTKLAGTSDAPRPRLENEATPTSYAYSRSTSSNSTIQNDKSDTIEASRLGRYGPIYENSSLFPRWPPYAESTNSQVPLAEDGIYGNSVLKHMHYGLANPLKSQDRSRDQTKLSDDDSALSTHHEAGLDPVSGASASGDTSFRHLH